MGYSRGTWRTKLSKYVIRHMKLIEQKNLVLVFTILFITSCQTNQNDVKESKVNKIIVSEDKLFASRKIPDSHPPSPTSAIAMTK